MSSRASAIFALQSAEIILTYPTPTRGVCQGEADNELGVIVTVAPADAPPPEDLPSGYYHAFPSLKN